MTSGSAPNPQDRQNPQRTLRVESPIDGRPPTLADVARVAGVGRGTASRALNDAPNVSPAARAAVLDAVTTLGYVPNGAARALVRRRTDTVALVVAEPDERVFGEPYFAAVVRGIGERLTEEGLRLVLVMAGPDGVGAADAAFLGRHDVDGVLLLSLHAEDHLAEVLEARGTPTVCGGRPATRRPPYVVDADNLAGGREAVQHLVGRGRRRLALLAGPQDMSSGRDRLLGARDAAAEAGLDPADVLVAYGDYSEESGRRTMEEVLDAGPPPDAVFAASDLMALGAARVLRARGLSVPGDVALVGFDDSPVCRHADPELTSVHQPVRRMGRVMADVLLARIAGRDVPTETVLPVRLVVRASS